MLHWRVVDDRIIVWVMFFYTFVPQTICKELVEPLLDVVQSDEKVAQLFDYLVANIIGKNGWSPHHWTLVYFVCHVFQVMACLLYGWCINVFIENYFLTYGYEVMKIVDSIVLQILHVFYQIFTGLSILLRLLLSWQEHLWEPNGNSLSTFCEMYLEKFLAVW